MTVNAPDFDPNLSGHSAVNLKQKDSEVCHAVVTKYTSDGEPIQQTECGQTLSEATPAPREEFDSSEYEICSKCWPKSVTEVE